MKNRGIKKRGGRLAVSFNTIAGLIGEEKALRLSRHIMHRHVYVRKAFNERDRLIPVVGRFALSLLMEKYGGELIHMTPAGGYVMEAARLLRGGASVEAVARRFNVSVERARGIARACRGKSLKAESLKAEKQKQGGSGDV